MNETTFSSLSPRRLLDEAATTFTLPYPSRCRQRRAVLHGLDAVTDLVDATLAATVVDDATPLSVKLDWIPVPAPAPVIQDFDERLREQALAAVDDIRFALGLSETAVARVSGIARNTLASWRRKQHAPYPATVRTLFEIHSLIAAVAALLGSHDAIRGWFNGPGPDGRARREILGEGTNVLTDELRKALFRQPASTLPTGTQLDEEITTKADPASPYTREAFSEPVTVDRPLR